MTVGAADIVAPVFAAAEVVVFFAARVAAETGFGNLFRRFVFEGDDLRWVAFFDVRFAGAVTRLATSHFLFPARELREFGVRSVREGFELVFVTVFACFAADVVFAVVVRPGLLSWGSGL